jgi:hypothetical protein
MINLSKEQRAEINRANALKSTGPKTPEGKKLSSMNALRSGTTGQIILMPNEDMQAYNAFVKNFHTSYTPQGPVETQYVQCMADSSWKLNRCRAHQDNILALMSLHCHINGVDQKLNATLAIAAAVAKCTEDLTRFSIYEQRQFRMFERSHENLTKMQETRKRQEKLALDEAEKFYKVHQYEELKKQESAQKAENEPPYIPQPYDPNQDGFLCTNADIKAHIGRRRCADAYFSLPGAFRKAA